MGEKRISDNDLGVLLRDYKKRQLPDYVLKIVEADLKSGLSKNQVALYTGRKLKECNVRAMSEALHKGISAALVSKLAKINEYKLGVVLEELRGGMSEEKILEVLGRDENAHGMKELFSQIKEDISKTEKKAIKEETGTDNKRDEEKGNSEKKPDAETVQLNPEAVTKVMESVLVRFTEGLTEALKPNLEYVNRLAEEINGMQSAVARKLDSEAEERLNKELDRMEKQVRELQNDLASSAGVIKSKDSEIARLKEEMDKMKESVDTDKDKMHTEEKKETECTEKESAGKSIADKSGDVNEHNVANNSVHEHKVVDNSVFTGNCQTVLRMADGKEIPVHIERTETRRPKGMLAMASRLFGGSESQKTLLEMLIDNRLSPEQLREIKRAKDNHFTDGELKDLIESELPAEEMSGIIDVIISDRR